MGMRISDLLADESIELGVRPCSKDEAIRHLISLMECSGAVTDRKRYTKDVLHREERGSTGMGDGIAMPHAKSAGVSRAALAAITVPDGLDFKAIDGKPARLLFLIAAPDGADSEHVSLLSQLAIMVMDPAFKESLINAKTKAEFRAIIDMKEISGMRPSEDDEDVPKRTKTPFVVAVTACPTGIAHTYMAAESLERHALKRGIRIKVETNGADGTKNVLTAKEIADADGVIVAADKAVEMRRFDGKRVVMAKAADGIGKADELFRVALSDEAPFYHAMRNDTDMSAVIGGESTARRVYKHLMNGVSHMLPFVVGGGILIALAFLLDSPEPAETFGSNSPYARFFNDTGGLAFSFMLPVLSGFIAMSIADRPGLAVGFMGGALAKLTGLGFLGAIIAGFVGGWIVNGLKRAFSVLPESLNGIRTVLIYPVLGIFIMGAVSVFIIAPPVSSLMNGLTEALKGMNPDARVFIGLIVGGMMAVDMGGPINKAAYVTGTGLLASGVYDVMASVMAGGMVPPLATALCTTIFRSRFTESERKAGAANYILGLSFITEGAIPFAASDPLRVIPACIVGSATAGALSMIFGCTLMAPHGGIFVVPTIGHPVMYLAAVFIGAIVSCLILAFFKKPMEED